MKAEEEIDKSEAATPYKLQEARKKGGVARSAEAASLLIFLFALAYLSWAGNGSMNKLQTLCSALLDAAGRVAPGTMLWVLSDNAIIHALLILAPLFAGIVLMAILGNIVQTGPMLSLEVLKPDFSRIHPANGFKRLWSMRTLYDGGRSVIKLAILGTVAWFALMQVLTSLVGTVDLSPRSQLQTLLQVTGSLGLKLAIALTCLALVDVVYTRREFGQRMRMSRREMRDEHKHREGDPRIRARMRELRREMLKRSQALGKVKTADVVITNPTHVAVALRYQHGQMEAPEIVAKGAGMLAWAIRRQASMAGVPIVQNPPLARALFHRGQFEGQIPTDLYGPVARIVVWVLAMREARRQAI